MCRLSMPPGGEQIISSADRDSFHCCEYRSVNPRSVLPPLVEDALLQVGSSRAADGKFGIECLTELPDFFCTVDGGMW